MLCVLNIAAFCQLDRFSSFEELDSLSSKYFEKNNLDSAILVIEYARSIFPEHDKDATYILDFFFLRYKQDSMTIENLDYGLRKSYFFGLEIREYNHLRNNPKFNRFAKVDKQIGDSLSKLSHMEYEIVLPANYSTDKKYPIIFVFHGNNWNIYWSKPVWASKIVKEKFITVYTQSYYLHESLYLCMEVKR